MSGVRLIELIKAVRLCKTAAQERALIAKECASIRTSFKDGENANRHRNVAKLLYIHMMGYSTAFGQMECLNLIVSPLYSDKRIGYLALMLLLDERQEVLTLITNTLRNDLASQNPFIVALGLCALGNISSMDIARDCAPDVEKLLSVSNPYIRKKAAICAIRVVRKLPEVSEQYVPKIRSLLSERNHGVLLTGITLCYELCLHDRKLISNFRKMTPAMVRLLKGLLQSGYAPEYDISGVTDPFLQVKLLRLLRLFGENDSVTSDAMNDVLAQVATNTEGLRNVGNAVLYECVLTIMSIDSESGLRVLAINILARFLSNRDNNLRYVALNALQHMVSIDNQSVQRHRNTVVECLKDPDISIRKRALDLIYELVNETNVRILVRELLSFLAASDSDFRRAIVEKICWVTEKYSPNCRWQFDTILRVMMVASKFVPEEVPGNLTNMIISAPEIHAYAVRKLYQALTRDFVDPVLIKFGLWCVGEFGDLLVEESGSNNLNINIVSGNDNGGGDPTVEDEHDLGLGDVSAEDVLRIFEKILLSGIQPPEVLQYMLTGLLKLSQRLNAEYFLRIKTMIENHQDHYAVELQQRACEYSQILRIDEDVRLDLVDRVPAPTEHDTPDETEGYVAEENENQGTSSLLGGAKIDMLPSKTSPEFAKDDILELLSGGVNNMGVSLQQVNLPTKTQESPATSGSVDLLDTLFGTSSSSQKQKSTASSASASVSSDLLDLLDSPSQGQTQPLPQQIIPQQQQQQQDLGKNQFSIPVLNDSGLSIVFNVMRSPNQPNVYSINVISSNSTPVAFSKFVLLAAVPKWIRLHIEQPSGSELPPLNGGNITQIIKLQNTLHGQKNVMMKLKCDYVSNGIPVTKQVNVPFP